MNLSGGETKMTERLQGGLDLSNELDSSHLDPVARGMSRRAFIVGLGAAALGATALGVGVGQWLNKQRVPEVNGSLDQEELQGQIDELKNELEKNSLGDCADRNEVRNAVGVPQLGAEECKADTQELWERLGEDWKEATPQASPKSNSGG